MLALGGMMVGLPGCSGGDSGATPPTATNVSTTTHEATATRTTTRTTTPPPEANYAILRTSVIDAADIDDGFEAPSLDQVVIGPEIAIFYEVEVPVQDGAYDVYVIVDIRILNSNFQGYQFFRHRGSADGETTQIIGHAPNNTDEFVPGDLEVHVAVSNDPSTEWRADTEFQIPVVKQTEEGSES